MSESKALPVLVVGAGIAGVSAALESAESGRDVLLVDTVGQLSRLYHLATVAFVGGSIATTGGQNVLEPAALCKPVLVGPHTFNFEEITRQLIDSQAALRIQNAVELEESVRRLFNDPELRDRMGRAGFELVRSGQGALDRTLEIVDSLLTRAVD